MGLAPQHDPGNLISDKATFQLMIQVSVSSRFVEYFYSLPLYWSNLVLLRRLQDKGTFAQTPPHGKLKY